MSKVELKSVTDRVAEYLTKHPSLRENDARLIANIWLEDAKAYNSYLDINRASYFLKMVAKGVLSNTESIRRARQLIQQKNPHLRGKNYNQRKEHSSDIKKEIIEIKENIHNQSNITYGNHS